MKHSITQSAQLVISPIPTPAQALAKATPFSYLRKRQQELALQACSIILWQITGLPLKEIKVKELLRSEIALVSFVPYTRVDPTLPIPLTATGQAFQRSYRNALEHLYQGPHLQGYGNTSSLREWTRSATHLISEVVTRLPNKISAEAEFYFARNFAFAFALPRH